MTGNDSEIKKKKKRERRAVSDTRQNKFQNNVETFNIPQLHVSVLILQETQLSLL